MNENKEVFIMKKVIALSMATLMAVGSLTGCTTTKLVRPAAANLSDSSASETENTSEAANTELSGDISVMVNNAFTGLDDPAILKAAKAFEELHPGVTITIEGLARNTQPIYNICYGWFRS